MMRHLDPPATIHAHAGAFGRAVALLAAALLAALLLAACAPPEGAPDLEAGTAAAVPYPRLLPLDAVLASAPPRIDEESLAADRERSARLRDRAAALGGPLIAVADRQRIASARTVESSGG